METPQQIEVIIDYETMGGAWGKNMNGFTRGVRYTYTEPNPAILQQYRTLLDVQTWFERGEMIPGEGQINRLDMRSAADGRRLHVSMVHNNRPLYSHTQQQNWDNLRNQYFNDFAHLQRRDRIPYHIDNFHELGEPNHGEHVPPLIIRYPSNESLEGLLPPNLRRDVEPPRRVRVQPPAHPHEADYGMLRRTQRRRIDAIPADRPPYVRNLHNPLPLEEEEELLAQEYGEWMLGIEQAIQMHNDRQHPRPNEPFIFHAAHSNAIRDNHIRRFNRQRFNDRVGLMEEGRLPPPGLAEPRQERELLRDPAIPQPVPPHTPPRQPVQDLPPATQAENIEEADVELPPATQAEYMEEDDV